MSGAASILRYDVDFKKVAGTITLTSTTIAWNPKLAGTMDRQRQAMNRAVNLLASKAGSERISLKILFRDDTPANGLMFTFTDPSSREEDRRAVQDTLIPFVSANRAGPSTPAVASPAPAGSTPGTATGAAIALKGKRKAKHVSPEVSGASGGKVEGPASYKARLRVLSKNPNLKILYRELVVGKQITEEEFWEGREALLQAEEMAYAQRPGRASRLLDDRFDLDVNRKSQGMVGGTGVGVKSKAETGPIVLNLSKELTREIFEEFPVVQDAYAKFVPGINETEFWSRYFTSQLWERHRASVRQSANDEFTRKRDDIFDQYLEEPDWNLQPRRAQPDDVERFLDLAATEEDHGEAITVRDHTMQAGRERSALPLIRRFNDHSNKLLRGGGYLSGSIDATSADLTSHKDVAGHYGNSLSNTAMPEGMDIYDEIEYDELRGPEAPSTIPLDVQDDQDMIDGSDEDNVVRGIMPGKSEEELLSIAAEQHGRIKSWHVDFLEVALPTPPGGWEKNRLESGNSADQTRAYERFQLQKDAQAAAMQVVKELHLASNAEHAVNGTSPHRPSGRTHLTIAEPFPESLLEQMRSCHNAATEFLRQYWSAILPTPTGAVSSAAAIKTARAGKMADYLRRTEGKVEAVIHTATIVGVDPARVRAALAPTMGAVNIALNRDKRLVGNGVA